jgi:hypothetical protein
MEMKKKQFLEIETRAPPSKDRKKTTARQFSVAGSMHP